MHLNYPRIAARIFNTPLMISGAKLDAIIAGLSDRIGFTAGIVPAALSTAQIEKREPGYDVIQGVARINVFGVLTHRGRAEGQSSWLLGYQQIAVWMQSALDDPAVHTIMLVFDTPGGEVAGLFDFAALISRADEVKPVYSMIDDHALSAGYAMAASGRSISISQTGGAGSIGVLMRHVDFSGMLEKDGVNVTHIFAGEHKIDGHPYGPLPDAVRADCQKEVDSLMDLFVGHVVEQRGMSAADVRATEAAVFTGEAAVQAGLADQVETQDELLQRLIAQQGNSSSTTAVSAAATTEEEITMSGDKTVAAESPAIFTQKQMDDASAKAVADAGGVSAETERKRVGTIIQSEHAKGREKLANHFAFNTSMSATDAIASLEAAPIAATKAAEPANNFAEAMSGLDGSDVGVDGVDVDDSAATVISQIVALTQPSAGVN